MNKLISLAAAATLALTWTSASADPEAAMAKAGCTACHAKDKKLVGPSFKDIAAKRKGEAEAEATLISKVRQGGKGFYGPIPMPPNPASKISDADLKEAVAWILKQ